MLFLLYSKGYSPQFLVYILPFIVLLKPNLSGLGYALLLELLNVLEQPTFFILLPEAEWLLAGVVSLRFLVLLALTLEMAYLIWPKGISLKLPFYTRRLLALLTTFGLILAMPAGWQSYYETQLQKLPQRDVIYFLQSQAQIEPVPLVLSDQQLYQKLYPFLHRDYQLHLAGGKALYPGAQTLEPLLNQKDQFWLYASGEQGAVVKEEAQILGRESQVFLIANQPALSLYQKKETTGTIEAIAQSETGIDLLSYHLEREKESLSITLFWYSHKQQSVDYTVFVQLLDEKGQLLLSQDGPPALGNNPTSTWTAQELIPDRHALRLPAELPSGNYHLIVGLYDQAGARLAFSNAKGQFFPDQAISLDQGLRLTID